MGFNVSITHTRQQTIAILGSMQIGSITSRELRTKNCSKQLDYNHGFGMGKSGIGWWMRARELPRSARPAKLQLEMWVKDPIQRPIQVIAAAAMAVRTARMTA